MLGAAHVGVLKAIKELEIQIDYIAGTSIGAFVAAFYAFGKSWEEIGEIALDLHWIDITEISLSRYGLLSNEKMGQLVIEHIGDKNIEDSSIPLAILATDASNGEKVILDTGSVAEAVMASSCIPGVFRPSDEGKKMLVDGGVVENVPIHTVRNMGAGYVIGVDLNAEQSYEKPENILDVILNSFHFIMKTAASLQTEDADLLIKPDLSAYNWTNMEHVEDLMEKGYQDARKALEKIK